MNRCLKKTIRDVTIIITISMGISLVVFTYHTWNNSNDAFERGLWLQSTEQQLKNQNEEYYNSLYDRYSRIHRDLNDYQRQTNDRLEFLENRVKSLEDSLDNFPISIHNMQINGDKR